VTLRARISAVASVAVALAVLTAAVALYIAVRTDLRGQIDESLRQRAREFTSVSATHLPGPPNGGPPAGAPLGGGGGGAEAGGGGAEAGSGGTAGGGAGAGSGGTAGGGAPPGRGGSPEELPRSVKPAPFGGASGYVQFISPTGSVDVPGGQGTSPSTVPPSGLDKQIAARGSGTALTDRTINGTHLRVLTIGLGANGAVLITRPLTEVDSELSRILLILAIVGVAGIALAALLGALVARTALTPIARFTRRTETLTDNLDLSERLEVSGRDELARLAESFNATLAALERSVEAQRHLIADASHELRTPIASLRANIQIIQDAERLPAEDRASLRQDILDELDELTSLVSDVVELARGAKGTMANDDVRLDQIVSDAIERTRRRGELRFEVQLEPTLLSGEADRINRAVSNLLDNARKWSPPQGLIEVTLSDGVLAVRDHGPGFQERDLPHVFERFYRADRARKLPGSGLGLAIVRQAAEAHQGYVKAENAPGGGALMTVSFGKPLQVPSPLPV
jgi:two-component system sensor histidine kinase MprB